jgi:hypothetical protein
MSQESPPDVQKEQIGGLELQVDAFSPVAPSEVTSNLADNAIERLEEGIRGDAQVGVESSGERLRHRRRRSRSCLGIWTLVTCTS